MSFDLFYISSHWGSEEVEQENKWTGEMQTVRPSLPMNADELLPVQALLDDAKTTGSDDDGYYAVEFQDGGRAEVFVSDLSTGLMVAVRSGFTSALLDFLFRLLKVGNLLMCPAMENAMTIGASETSFQEAPDGLPQKVVCNSPEELGVLLSEGFDNWKGYRDQVVGQ